MKKGARTGSAAGVAWLKPIYLRQSPAAMGPENQTVAFAGSGGGVPAASGSPTGVSPDDPEATHEVEQALATVGQP